jgi:HK97 family phage prohead protease
MEIKRITTLQNQMQEVNDINLNDWEGFVNDKKELENFNTEEKYLVTGYASTWDLEHPINNQADRVMPNAFDNILNDFYQNKTTIKMLSQHEAQETPLGRVIGFKKDAKGLMYLAWGYKNAVDEKGQKFYDLLKDKLLDTSFGFSVGEYKNTKEGNIDVRNILKFDSVREISLVTFPRNKEAKVLNVKAEENDIQEGMMCNASKVRKALQLQYGMSANKANNIIQNMKNKKSNEEEINELKNQINELKNSLNELKSQQITQNNIESDDDILTEYGL